MLHINWVEEFLPWAPITKYFFSLLHFKFYSLVLNRKPLSFRSSSKQCEQYALILSAHTPTKHFSSFKLHYWGHTTNRCACKPDTVQADQGKICKFASEQRVIPPTVLISKFLFFVAHLKTRQSNTAILCNVPV